MKAIGFRAASTGIHWAVVTGTHQAPEYIEHDYVAAPKISSEGDRLTYFRNRTIALIKRIAPDVAMIRYPEPFRPKGKNPTSNDERSRVEGVMLETLCSHGVATKTGWSVQIGAMIGHKKPLVYLDQDDLRGLIYPVKDKACRESILAAVAALGGDDDGSTGANEV